MQISPQEKTHLAHQSPLAWDTLADPPQDQSGAGAPLPNIRGKCSPGVKLLCLGGAHHEIEVAGDEEDEEENALLVG